ncbi:hypothetical protein, conserved [Eimeria maxima]|uniref:Uncharacterized protein n=1 Tax=Eimeria maxima TaxID=5804 RepID=U6LX52_EIMMA|nr:hypothetical protein, conserved [Eimeria maxima]CDJ56316.1 hypothetical protein, conserved [Eimeria maxima]
MDRHVHEIELECQEACSRLRCSLETVNRHTGEEAPVLERLVADCRRDAHLFLEKLRHLELEARFESPANAVDPSPPYSLVQLRQELRTLSAEVDAAERRLLIANGGARREGLLGSEAKMSEGCKQLEVSGLMKTHGQRHK